MADLNPGSKDQITDQSDRSNYRRQPSQDRYRTEMRLPVLPIFITLTIVAIAVLLSRAMWNTYMDAPWTRDAAVRVHVVTMAPEVAGRIVALPVTDDQFVDKGQLLMVIDPTDYAITVRLAQAAVQQSRVNAQNAAKESNRRQEQTDLSVTLEEQQIYETNAVVTAAQYQQGLANLDKATVNLERTQIHSPVNGWVTNLLSQLGDYANVGQNQITVVDADSYWVDGYFEETSIASIHEGDPVEIKLMGSSQIVRGHVRNIARAIEVPNAQPDWAGLASVNPIFTWVRLAQRIPVHIDIDHVPAGVRLVAGMTATVQVDPRPTVSKP